MKVNISIVDDDKEIQDLLEDYLLYFAKENGVEFFIQRYGDGISFLDGDQIADIVLMDIEMPVVNGMKVAEEMRKRNSDVALIFITNSTRYAVKGYSVDAIDYVLKPVNYRRFSSLIKKVLRIIGKNLGTEILIKATSGICKVYASNIVYVEINGHLLNYYTLTGKIEAWGALKEVERHLPVEQFVRCNHNCIVNLQFVSAVGKDTLSLREANVELSVSRSKKKEVISRLNAYIEKNHA